MVLPSSNPGNEWDVFTHRKRDLGSIDWFVDPARAALFSAMGRGVVVTCYQPLSVDPYAIDIHCEGIAMSPDGRSHTQLQVSLDAFIESYATYCRLLTGDAE
jgi:hypothetical protein